MAIEVNEIQPQSVVDSPHHQNLADGVEALFKGAWNWIQQHLPEHETAKPNALNNIVAAYDNAIAAVRADAAATAAKLEEQGKTALQTVEEGAVSAGEAVVTGVEQAAEAIPTVATTPAQGSASSSAGADTTTGAPAVSDTPTS